MMNLGLVFNKRFDPDLDFDIIEKKQPDGTILTRKVLYKKDGTEVIFSNDIINPVEEVAKIDTQIADLQATKIEYQTKIKNEITIEDDVKIIQ